MNNFIAASKQKLRFSTSVGLLSVEQLWDLKLPQLIDIEDNLKEIVEKGEIKSSRRKGIVKTSVQTENELKLSIVSEILDIKEAEQESIKNANDIKAYNAKIDALIAQKQEKELADLSIEELMKLRK